MNTTAFSSKKSSDPSLTAEEQAFLDRARGKFLENTNWFQFEDFAFGMRSPLFSKTRSHRNVRDNPLFIALQDMWLQLGVKQGFIAPPKGKGKHASRRKA